MKQLTILITGGGTKVQLDEVRHIGNFSKGGFATEIANAAATQGHRVYLLGSADMFDRHGRNLHADIERHRYIFFDQFQEQYETLLATLKPDVLIMAAALSDFVPKDQQVGKIESRSIDELQITLIKAPKLLPLAKQLSPTTFVAGFKLLVGATTEAFLDKAKRQFTECKSDLCVGNNLNEINKDTHPMMLIAPDSSYREYALSKTGAAKIIIDEIANQVHAKETTHVTQ